MTKHASHAAGNDNDRREQPANKKRGRTTRRPGPDEAREATRDPKLTDSEKTPGSGMASDDDEAEAPSG